MLVVPVHFEIVCNCDAANARNPIVELTPQSDGNLGCPPLAQPSSSQRSGYLAAQGSQQFGIRRPPSYLSPDDRALIGGRQVAEGETVSLRGWYPVVVTRGNGNPGVWWRFVGDEPLTEPFFCDTLGRLAGNRRVSRFTSVDSLRNAGGLECLSPTAFLFHASRCGSTLLAQLLATLPGGVVLSEPPAVESFLRCAAEEPTGPFDHSVLAGLIRVMGQRRSSADRHYFIKFECWHIHSLPLLRAIFPGTPCVFLYRRPAEILASHRRQRGRHMVSSLVAPAMLDTLHGDSHPADLDSFCARVLASFFRAAARFAAAGKVRLVHASQLPDLVWSGLLDDFSLPCSQSVIAPMKARARFHAKRPTDPFAGDPPTVRAASDSPAHQQAVASYEILEELRRQSDGTSNSDRG